MAWLLLVYVAVSVLCVYLLIRAKGRFPQLISMEQVRTYDHGASMLYYAQLVAIGTVLGISLMTLLQGSPVLLLCAMVAELLITVLVLEWPLKFVPDRLYRCMSSGMHLYPNQTYHLYRSQKLQEVFCFQTLPVSFFVWLEDGRYRLECCIELYWNVGQSQPHMLDYSRSGADQVIRWLRSHPKELIQELHEAVAGEIDLDDIHSRKVLMERFYPRVQGHFVYRGIDFYWMRGSDSRVLLVKERVPK